MVSTMKGYHIVSSVALASSVLVGCEPAPTHYEPPTLSATAEADAKASDVPIATAADRDPDLPEAEPRVRSAVAVMHGTATHGGVTGTVRLTEAKAGEVIVSVELDGLEPGSRHGFHVHEAGDCSASDASSAGGHFAPRMHDHDLPPAERHAGDMGNVEADEKGQVKSASTYGNMTLAPQAPASVLGRAIILHAEPDDGKGDSGHAGPRIACGVIGRG